jgi:hypothetical protein
LALSVLMFSGGHTASAATSQAAPPESHAQPREPDEIDGLYEAGKAALGDGEAALALGQFKAALHLASGQEHRTWPLLLAVALAYKQSDAPGHAIEYFRRFLALTDAHQGSLTLKWKQRRDRVSAVLLELEKKLEQTHGFISVTSIPAGAAIVVDGTRAGADRDAVTPFGLILPAGDHMLQLSHDGHSQIQRIVTIKAGSRQSLPISLESTAPSKGPSVTEATLAAPASVEDTSVVPWVTMGVGAGVGCIGAVLTILAAGESSELDAIRAVGSDPGSEQGAIYGDEWTEHASALDTYQMAAAILYGLAAASVATGVVLLVLQPSEAPQAASSLLPAIDLTATPGGVTGHATWRF